MGTARRGILCASWLGRRGGGGIPGVAVVLDDPAARNFPWGNRGTRGVGRGVANQGMYGLQNFPEGAVDLELLDSMTDSVTQRSILDRFMIALERHRDELNRVCRQAPVKRLGVFGSALREDYDDESDIDILVLFDDAEQIDYFTEYFRLKEDLEKIFDREVDLVVDRPFRNPVFQKAVDRDRMTVYER